MKEINGDLIELAKNGEFDVIVHGCNCFCQMGAGIAKQIKREFPKAFKADKETIYGSKHKLGNISTAVEWPNENRVIIVNAYTQYDYRGTGTKADLKAIKSCFKMIKRKYSGKRIGIPKIGAGLAKGNWNLISKIIDDEMKDENLTLVNFWR